VFPSGPQVLNLWLESHSKESHIQRQPHLTARRKILVMPLSNWKCYYTILMLAMGAKAIVPDTPFIPQSFFFDWNPSTEEVPIPTTAQCDTINITWGRQSATGPNPVAPYLLQVYTSAQIVPFIIPAGNGLTFDWAVPFNPGTLVSVESL
jgi:hypothetical protein